MQDLVDGWVNFLVKRDADTANAMDAVCLRAAAEFNLDLDKEVDITCRGCGASGWWVYVLCHRNGCPEKARKATKALRVALGEWSTSDKGQG